MKRLKYMIFSLISLQMVSGCDHHGYYKGVQLEADPDNLTVSMINEGYVISYVSVHAFSGKYWNLRVMDSSKAVKSVVLFQEHEGYISEGAKGGSSDLKKGLEVVVFSYSTINQDQARTSFTLYDSAKAGVYQEGVRPASPD